MFVLTKRHNATLNELTDVRKAYLKISEEKAELADRNEKLNEEIKKLADIISSSNKECSIGPWCKDCDHVRHDKYGVQKRSRWGGYYYANPDEDEVMYCVKHLHELCPEHSKNNQEG